MFRRALLLSEFLDTVYVPSRLDIAPGTIGQLNVAVHVYQAWLGRPPRLSDLTDDLVLRFLRDYAQDHSAASVNTKRGRLLALWRLAGSKGYVKRAPGNIPKLREPDHPPQAWRVEELAKLVRHSRSLRGTNARVPRRRWWGSLILAEFCTGCRITALRSTLSADCDLDEGTLIVRGYTQKTKRDQLFRLSDQATAGIRLIYDAERELVWPWPHCDRWFWTHFRRLAESAGLAIPPGGMNLFQRIRRSAVSYAACESLELARRLAGHTSA